MDDFVQKLLGPGAITLIVLALFQFVQKLRENRTTLRSSYENREAERSARMEARLDAFYSLAEAHQPWDGEMRAAVVDLRQEVNYLRIDRGEEPRVWVTLPSAPPLFPKFSDHEKSSR